MIATTPRSKLSMRAARRGDVGGFRIVDEPHAVNLADELEHVLQPAEALDRALHRQRRHAGQHADRRRREHIAEQMPARETHRCERQQRRRPPSSRRTIWPPTIVTPLAIGASSAKSRRRAATPAASASDGGSSALTTAQSSGVWFRKIRALAAAYSSNDA